MLFLVYISFKISFNNFPSEKIESGVMGGFNIRESKKHFANVLILDSFFEIKLFNVDSIAL